MSGWLMTPARYYLLAMLQTDEITALVERQRGYYGSGATRPLAFRRDRLRDLLAAVDRWDRRIVEALRADMGKPEFESYGPEVGYLRSAIRLQVRNLRTWSRERRVRTPIALLPARSRIIAEPRGVALIVAPWNYPFLLLLEPLAGAVAAGNCAVLKPSEQAPNTSRLVADMIQEIYDPEYVSVVEGQPSLGAILVEQAFDLIFFTGGAARGAEVMAAASRNLVPCVLELGGKSPCIVSADALVRRAARHIAWGKWVNAGQTCIAPDYVLVDRRIRDELTQELAGAFREFSGGNPIGSPDYGRIVNTFHFDRLMAMMRDAHVLYGGEHSREDLKIAPTVLGDVPLDASIMQEEVFGPLLPVLSYDTLEDALEVVSGRPRPVAVYLFTTSRAVERSVSRNTSSGGLCINTTMIHAINPQLPFGGVGASGLGRYHGRASFDTFTHWRSVLKRPGSIPLPLIYPPYGRRVGLLRKAVR